MNRIEDFSTAQREFLRSIRDNQPKPEFPILGKLSEWMQNKEFRSVLKSYLPALQPHRPYKRAYARIAKAARSLSDRIEQLSNKDIPPHQREAFFQQLISAGRQLSHLIAAPPTDDEDANPG